jgi:nickel/cobalt exporter
MFIEFLKETGLLINSTIASFAAEFSFSSFLILIGISFAYGIVHSIGPGHDKLLVASYFSKEKQAVKNIFKLGGVISLVHSGSAVIISFLLFYIFTAIKGIMKIQLQGYFILVSGILITVVGLVFLILKVIKKDEISINTSNSNINTFLLGAAAGIVPCPAALMIMLMAIGKNIIFVGLTSVLFISLGMFLVLSAVGFLSLTSREKVLNLAEGGTRKSILVSEIIEYLSMVAIIAIGLSITISMIVK